MSSTFLRRPAAKRSVAMIGAGALMMGTFGFLVTPANAAPVRADLSATCDGLEDSPFIDIDGRTQEAQDAIGCLFNYDITQGRSADEYAPADTVSRQEMAIFIAREVQYIIDNSAVDYTGPAPASDYSDRDELTAEGRAAVDLLTDLGVVTGNTDGTYDGERAITRAEMAVFIDRVQDIIAEEFGEDARYNPEDADATFTDIDDDDFFADAVYSLQSVGIVQGTGSQNYSPDAPVIRADMAFFIMRHLDENIVADRVDSLSVTAPGTVTLNSNTVQSGGTLSGNVSGTNNRSVTVSGCGFTNSNVALGAFSLVIPASQPVGGCTLTFTITDNAGVVRTQTLPVTVTAATVAQGTGTSRPELASATVVQTLATGGTTVRFTFDEALTGSSVGTGDEAAFAVYTFASTGVAGRTPATLVRTDEADTRSVLATYAGITTTAGAAALSVATVDEGVVTDLQGESNIIGDAGLNPGGVTTTQLTPGVTVAPDLVTVGNFRANAGDANTTLVDFTFDEAADAVNPTYFLVSTDGVTVRTGTAVAGDSTTVHTVRFDNRASDIALPSTVTLTAAGQARGVVETNTVDEDASGNVDNVRQSADISNAGNSETPDLVSTAIIRDTNIGGGVVRDQILFTFDEPVLVGAGEFRAYLSNGNEIVGTGATRSTANDTQVLVNFGTDVDALDLAVGASVGIGAVTEGAGTNRPNQLDEVALSNVGTGPTNTTVSGRTDAPDLIAVGVERVTDAFGTTTGGQVRFTFDEDIAGVLVPADFSIVEADGTIRRGVGATIGTTEDTDSQVVVTFAGSTTDAILRTVVGTVNYGAVANQLAPAGTPPGTGIAGAELNPEGAQLATGSTGTPRA